MCTTWSIQQYRDLGEREGYPIQAEYVNEANQSAITVPDSDGDLINVYSENGRDQEAIWAMVPSDERTIEAQRALAIKRMAERGFHLVVPSTAVAATETETELVIR